MSDIIITGILSVWLLVTVICQFQPGFKSIVKWPDFLLFVLSTRLFVRVPANMHIWYRDLSTIGELGSWQRIAWDGNKSWVSLSAAPCSGGSFICLASSIVWSGCKEKGPARNRSPTFGTASWLAMCNPYHARMKAGPGNSGSSGAGHILHEDPAILFTSEFHLWLPGSPYRRTRCN